MFATRGRTALTMTALGATLATGIGAAGMSAASASTGAVSEPPAAAPATTTRAAVAHAPDAQPDVPLAADPAPGAVRPRLGAASGTQGPVGAPARLKARPLPKRQWVHPLPSAAVTSCFGQRWGRLHAGVDLAAAFGAPVVAAGAGTVVSAGLHGGYGNSILIDHGNGYLTHYGHLSVIGVEVGQVVKAGEHIGDEGSTGHSTGPHLHFEVHEGHFQNPLEPTTWMRTHGVEISGCAAV
ncbi:M23 family metallopeptidase [Actinoplanes flavus]|uniref:M23 family metallopeptidase n=1 Tax=Actinoplanes flavus TaxID=2820290 RepID=A0ABS3UHG3_9ACTN|nr:M23 family metallopeptidase [Actinoplanes flavus]MBO3738225.1 M23 family metallopeptidase [Actinoplanes flavus]